MKIEIIKREGDIRRELKGKDGYRLKLAGGYSSMRVQELVWVVGKRLECEGVISRGGIKKVYVIDEVKRELRGVCKRKVIDMRDIGVRKVGIIVYIVIDSEKVIDRNMLENVMPMIFDCELIKDLRYKRGFR